MEAEGEHWEAAFPVRRLLLPQAGGHTVTLFCVQPNPSLKVLPASRWAVAGSLLDKRQDLGGPGKLSAGHHT